MKRKRIYTQKEAIALALSNSKSDAVLTSRTERFFGDEYQMFYANGTPFMEIKNNRKVYAITNPGE